MRDSPSLDIVPALLEAGAGVRAYDPEGMEEAKQLLGTPEGLSYCDDAYATLTDADAVVIVTEWNEFRALDLARVKSAMRQPLMVDLRNVYDPKDMADDGFVYHCIGRPSAESAA